MGNWFQEVINSFEFYFEFLPANWDNKETCEKLAANFDEKSAKETIILMTHYVFVFAPGARKNAKMKGIDSLIKDIDAEKCLGFFALKYIDIGTEHHILEFTPAESEKQEMINKVEKVFLVCNKDLSHREVITLESDTFFGKAHFLCGAGLNGVHSNYGPVKYENVYNRLKEIISKNSSPAIVTH